MTLYIKQKVFSLGDKYSVYDKDQNVIFSAEGEIFSFGAKIHLLDSFGNELMFIKQRLMSFLPAYEIYTKDNLFATIQKKFTFFYKKIEVTSSYGDFTIEGDFFDHDYKIFCNGKLFGSVYKEWLTWGDTYALDINSEDFSEFFVALVLAIDNILQIEQN